LAWAKTAGKEVAVILSAVPLFEKGAPPVTGFASAADNSGNTDVGKILISHHALTTMYTSSG